VSQQDYLQLLLVLTAIAEIVVVSFCRQQDKFLAKTTIPVIKQPAASAQ
jgi:hypothetical protein